MERDKLEKRRGLSGFDLKIIGIIFMVLDHSYDAFVSFGAPLWMTLLGRTVAPIFLFLSAEGFYYTHSKWKYMRNLLLFFWLTNLVTMTISSVWPNDQIVLINSMLGTLFLSVLAMWSWDGLLSWKTDRSYFWKSLLGWAFILITPFIVIALLGMSLPMIVLQMVFFLPNAITVEGGIVFIFLGLLFYIFREKRWVQVSLLMVLALIVGLRGNWIQAAMGFAALPIALYNGAEGKKMKWFFYIFYPAHIAVIYLVATWFFF